MLPKFFIHLLQLFPRHFDHSLYILDLQQAMIQQSKPQRGMSCMMCSYWLLCQHQVQCVKWQSTTPSFPMTMTELRISPVVSPCVAPEYSTLQNTVHHRLTDHRSLVRASLHFTVKLANHTCIVSTHLPLPCPHQPVIIQTVHVLKRVNL